MLFNDRLEVEKFIGANHLKDIGYGAQGSCYLNLLDNRVYKFFNDYLENDDDYMTYRKEELLRFKNVVNRTYIWYDDVIMVENRIVGCICNYVNGKSLYKVDPLTININKFIEDIKKVIEDIKIISSHGIITYDVMYNILYGMNGFNIIDPMEYYYSFRRHSKLFEINSKRFGYEVILFLIHGYFDNFVSMYADLSKMYDSFDCNVLEFVLLFKKYLSEYIEDDVCNLGDAKKALMKKENKGKIYTRRKDHYYIRGFNTVD